MIGSSESSAILSEYIPTGASDRTSKGSELQGVEFSRMVAEKDGRRVLAIADRFMQASHDFDLPPALLAAIASRESRIGLLLDRDGWGDFGNAFGIMQIDKRHHIVLGRPDPRSVLHIQQAADILQAYFVRIKKIHPQWPMVRQLQGAVAAYNVGVKNVRTLAGMDRGTTHDDYSNDVWARAQYFAGIG